jgi:ubiquinone/menaquinone biosynthesis C-methylase UbiE
MRPTEERNLTRRAFDGAALWYDHLHATDSAFRHSRSYTHRIFLKYFRPGDRLLELNCGTGIDAVFLAGRGMHVHATDLSPGMIAEVKRKIALQDLATAITTEERGFDELRGLTDTRFDGAYSNFGGLNCTGRLDDVATTLAALVKPGAYMIATVMSDFCLWETLAMLSRLRWSAAIRRSAHGGIPANLGGETVTTYYYPPARFVEAFGENFHAVEILGLNILTPPLNHFRAYRLLRPLLPILYAVDEVVAPLPIFRRIGDHYIAVLRRNEE